MRLSIIGLLLGGTCLLPPVAVVAQSSDPAMDKVVNFPVRLFSKLHRRTADLNQQLTRQASAYLEKMARQEQRLQKKLSSLDPTAAKGLFAHSQEQYTRLLQQLQTDTGSRRPLASLTGTYQPYMDSLQGALAFLQKNPGWMRTKGQPSSPAIQAQLQGATRALQAFQAKMQVAGQAQTFIQQRRQEITQYINTHATGKNLLNKSLSGLNRQAYYYSQQLRSYRELWDHPDQLEQKALSMLNKLPAFQTFMKDNSQLGNLFHLPGNYGASQTLSGLQTRDQVSQLIQQQVAAAGANGPAALAANLQSAGSQLDGYKSRLSQLGTGNGDLPMPDFAPNDQRTKTFWKRLEYGTNFQTTHNSYYFPTVTDLGLSLGYRLGHSNVIGVGASYKLGWGNGIQHIALSSQGAGLRSFVNIHLKSSFSATGGWEYNYTTPFTSFQQIRRIDRWTESGLIGVTKTVSMKSRMFKKTALSLLWDFLSYRQTPPTQPLLFRIGYTVH